MRYAIFSRGGKPRVMHAVKVRREAVVYSDGSRGTNGDVPETATVCELPIGVGSGLVRDGNYAGSVPCRRCWS